MAVVERELFLELCSKIPFFQDFSREDLAGLATSLNYVHKYRAGDVIINQGAQDRALYVLLSGRCKVTHNDCPGKVLQTLSPGEVFGEMSMLTGQPRSANVCATTQSIVLRVDQKLLELVPPIVRNHFKDSFIRILAGRIDQLTIQLAKLTLH